MKIGSKRSIYKVNKGIGGVLCCPRGVKSTNGTIYCGFVQQSEQGINDFRPMLTKSLDGGKSWSKPEFIWSEIKDYSIFGSLSIDKNDTMYFYGTRTLIDVPGESFWQEKNQGIKQNELIWSKSLDHGQNWSKFSVIPMPQEGSAEAPGAMCISSKGDLIACYAPYNNFEIEVKKNLVICLYSKDDGLSWNSSEMINFPYQDSNGAESWVVELSNGRLLGATWHIRREKDESNAYSISEDGGKTWRATRSTGIYGQSIALSPLDDNRVIMVYNQRKYGEIGVWLSVASPDQDNYNVQLDKIVWRADTGSKVKGLVNPDDWENFTFGEPSTVIMPGGEILVLFWNNTNDTSNISCVKVKL